MIIQVEVEDEHFEQVVEVLAGTPGVASIDGRKVAGGPDDEGETGEEILAGLKEAVEELNEIRAGRKPKPTKTLRELLDEL